MDSLQELWTRPYYQALVFLILSVLVLLLPARKRADTLWVRVGIVYVIFIAFNSILVFTAVQHWFYFFYSIGASILYLLAIGLLVKGATRFHRADGSEESSMIFLAIIYHPVLLLFFIFIKWMVF